MERVFNVLVVHLSLYKNSCIPKRVKTKIIYCMSYIHTQLRYTDIYFVGGEVAQTVLYFLYPFKTTSIIVCVCVCVCVLACVRLHLCACVCAGAQGPPAARVPDGEEHQPDGPPALAHPGLQRQHPGVQSDAVVPLLAAVQRPGHASPVPGGHHRRGRRP